MKRLILIFILIGLVFLTSHCQRNEKSTAQSKTIALVMKTLNNPFFIDMQRGAEDAAPVVGLVAPPQGEVRARAPPGFLIHSLAKVPY